MSAPSVGDWRVLMLNHPHHHPRRPLPPPPPPPPPPLPHVSDTVTVTAGPSPQSAPASSIGFTSVGPPNTSCRPGLGRARDVRRCQPSRLDCCLVCIIERVICSTMQHMSTGVLCTEESPADRHCRRRFDWPCMDIRFGRGVHVAFVAQCCRCVRRVIFPRPRVNIKQPVRGVL